MARYDTMLKEKKERYITLLQNFIHGEPVELGVTLQKMVFCTVSLTILFEARLLNLRIAYPCK